MGYHAMTFGWILGEVVRRVDGRPFGQFVQEEICQPLGLGEQLYFGIPDAAEPRVATADLGPPANPPPAPDSLAVQALPLPLRRIFNRPDVRRACIPAVNGLMTARALAAHYAALIGTGIDGVRLLPPERVAVATVPLPDEPDVVWGIKAARALGYLLGGPEPDNFAIHVGGRRGAFGFPGIGGIIGFADREYGLAVGIAMTTPSGGAPEVRPQILQCIRALLGIPEQPAL
jgi:CubicO group peptidase (beta-lactamase class C family)